MLSCKEEESAQQSFEDAQIIDLYIRSYGLEGNYISGGIFKSELQAGSGEKNPQRKQGVVVNYSLKLANKTEINYGRNILIQQGIETFFEGFDLAVASMVKGEESTFLIPSEMAYGTKSYAVNGRKIPYSAVILLEVELVDIIDEKDIMDYYFSSKGLPAEKTSSGIFYKIDKLNSSNLSPDINDIVSIEYDSYYLSDTSISEDQTASFVINEQQYWDDTGIINGLEEAVLLLKEGDEGLFAIPSVLAYGNDGNSSIPPDAILLYKIKLKTIKK
jgi:FKBP-type peptidyl-prolyl cis-trans isomerase